MKYPSDLPVALSASVAAVQNHATAEIVPYEQTGFELDAGPPWPAGALGARNPALVYLAGLSEGSRQTMRGALDTMAAILLGAEAADGILFPWHAVRYQHAQAVRTALRERYSPRTANKMLSALRCVLRESWRLGLMSSEDYLRAADVKAVKGGSVSQAEAGRHLQAGELSALIAACTADGTDAGVRDAAIIGLGYLCGLRRAELASLTVDAFDPETHALRVEGKGGKTRVVYVENGALDALTDWLSIRGGRGDPLGPGAAGPLFVAYRRGDHMAANGMSGTALHRLMKRRSAQAGVKEFSPHDLRRTFAGDLLDAGADIATVQKIMGHASVSTTAGYDRRDARAKQRAATRLHLPYQKRGS